MSDSTLFFGAINSSVAICTLEDNDLAKELYFILNDKICIIGSCSTENHGIEKIIKRILQYPNIRHLILCGNENNLTGLGHSPGQAFIALYENGLDGNCKIIGVKGIKSVLRNVSESELIKFQHQIALVNLIGTTHPLRIVDEVMELLSKNVPPIDYKVSRFIKKQNAIIAKNQEKLILDKKGYFIILPDRYKKKIFVEYYSNNGLLIQVIKGNNSTEIYYTIIKLGFISQLDHAAYLGRELTKADYYLKYNIPYIQDKAMGEIIF